MVHYPYMRKRTSNSKQLLDSGFWILDSRRAFTLIETLIVIAISAMLAAIAVGYSSVSRNEVSLSVEAAEVSQMVLEAKSLAIATYGNAAGACGYGVSFDYSNQTYSLFTYVPQGFPSCPSAASTTEIAPGDMQEYTGGTSKVAIANGVVLSPGSSNDGVAVALFYPPAPQTFIARNGDFDSNSGEYTFTNENSNIYLETVDGSASTAISVSSAGQVSF